MNVVKEIERINEKEMELGITVGHGSWHDEYSDSAYVFIGGLPIDITEGDVLVLASQFGTPIDVNLVRDRQTGAVKGFAFVAYADQRSTVLAVDNFTGAEFFGRTLRCDHVPSYRFPTKKNDPKKKRAVTDDSSSSDSDTDSELELYRGETDGLNPLQRRMIRAKVKRDLAAAEQGVKPEDDDADEKAKADSERRFTHSFYAVEETSGEKKKRLKTEKREAKRAKKARKREDEERAARAAAASTNSEQPKGGMSNPFLAAKLRELASKNNE